MPDPTPSDAALSPERIAEIHRAVDRIGLASGCATYEHLSKQTLVKDVESLLAVSNDLLADRERLERRVAELTRPKFTPAAIQALQERCDRVPDTDRLTEMAAEARAALAKVSPPTPENDNPLYYPLLFLVESAEPVARWLDEDDEPARATPEPATSTENA